MIAPDGRLLIKHRKLNEQDIAHDLYDTGDRLNVCHTELGTIGLMVCADAGVKEFQMWIIGVSNVGWLTAGPWKDWKCIGCSLVIDPDGNEVLQAPYGVDADTIIYIDVETRERPARGTDWNEYWNKGN